MVPLVGSMAADHELTQQVDGDVEKLAIAQAGVVGVERQLLLDHVQIGV